VTKTFQFAVGEAETGERLDYYVSRHIPRLSRNRAKSLIVDGFVTVDEEFCKPAYRLRRGEIVAGSYPDAPVETVNPEDVPLTVYYGDEHIVVAEKPAGMLTHPTEDETTGTLVNALLHHCGTLAPVGAPFRPGIVHRLDRGTSGVLVVARSELAHRNLVRQFSERTTGRVYAALVYGVPAQTSGLIDAPIGRSASDPTRFAVSPLAPKEALTEYRVEEKYGGAALLRLKLRTGRTHQIRVHLSYIGHPILGDETYGGPVDLIDRPALHAHSLSFDHPATGARMCFVSPLAGDLVELIRCLK
jgi:23S rRNA pseudouridine1911/1915/1917 synthase